jgi:hypothetical protein
MQEAYSRLRRNAGYFRVNYLILSVLTVAATFITHPSSLLVLMLLLGLWVYMFALKQGPLVLGDREFRCAPAARVCGVVCVPRGAAQPHSSCSGACRGSCVCARCCCCCSSPPGRVCCCCSEREKLAGMLGLSFLVVFFFSK